MYNLQDYREDFRSGSDGIFYVQIHALSKELELWKLLRDMRVKHVQRSKLFCFGESPLLEVQLRDLSSLEHVAFHVANLSLEAAALLLSHPTLQKITILGTKLEDSPGYHMLASASQMLNLDVQLHPNTTWVNTDLHNLMHRCFRTLEYKP